MDSGRCDNVGSWHGVGVALEVHIVCAAFARVSRRYRLDGYEVERVTPARKNAEVEEKIVLARVVGRR